MRFERKYITPNNIRSQLKSFLRINNSKESFPTRKITSIYYDTYDFKSYFESEDGNPNRTKIRLRFYDNNINDGKIEYKIKSSELGNKKYFEIKEIIRKFGSLKLKHNNSFLEIPKKINNYFPVLFVEYLRDYYESYEGKIRITYDHNIKFKNLMMKRVFLFDSNVIEIKYERNNDLEYEIINKLLLEFDLNLTRFSKYCKGIQICF